MLLKRENGGFVFSGVSLVVQITHYINCIRICLVDVKHKQCQLKIRLCLKKVNPLTMVLARQVSYMMFH